MIPVHLNADYCTAVLLQPPPKCSSSRFEPDRHVPCVCFDVYYKNVFIPNRAVISAASDDDDYLGSSVGNSRCFRGSSSKW